MKRLFVENTWYAAAWDYEVAEADNKLGRLNDLTMHIPGIFLMETTFGPASCPEDETLRKQCREYRNCQFMTPETRNTTHFFWNYLHNTNIDNPEVSASLKDSLLEGYRRQSHY